MAFDLESYRVWTIRKPLVELGMEVAKALGHSLSEEEAQKVAEVVAQWEQKNMSSYFDIMPDA